MTVFAPIRTDVNSALNLQIDELEALDAPSDWSDFVNGTLTGLALVAIGIAIT